jgi:hypothetical protein
MGIPYRREVQGPPEPSGLADIGCDHGDMTELLTCRSYIYSAYHILRTGVICVLPPSLVRVRDGRHPAAKVVVEVKPKPCRPA